MKISWVFFCLAPIFSTVKSIPQENSLSITKPDASIENRKLIFPSMKKFYVTEKNFALPSSTAKPMIENRKVVFPSKKKFFVTEKPVVKENIVVRKPLMPKLHPKFIEPTNEFMFKSPVIRRPLMKSVKLITDLKKPRTTSQTKAPVEVTTNAPMSTMILIQDYDKAKSLSLSEKINNKKAANNNEQKDVLDNKQEKQPDKSEATTKIFSEDDDFATEMIPIQSMTDEKSFDSDAPIVPFSSDVSDEELLFINALNGKTKEVGIIDGSPKQKRSINVIEEENQASMVAGFKFTGKESRLTNDINS